MSEEATLDDFAEQEGSDDVPDEHPRFGLLPDDWEICEISSIAEVVGGSTPSTSNEDYWGGGIPWATPTDITGLSGNTISETEDTITEEGLNSASTHLLPPNSVLMTSRATIGKCAINTVEMATNQGFKNLVPGDGVEPWYLYYRMLDTAAFLNSLGSGSTFDEVSKTEVQSVDIPVPPLPEQRKIATVLYTVDRAIEKTEEITHSTKLVKRGLSRDLLSRGIAESGVIRPDSETNPDIYQEHLNGKLPQSWSVKQVSEVVEDDRPVTYGIVQPGSYVEDGVPMIRGQNYINGWEPLSEIFRVDPELHREYNRCITRPRDVLLCIAGANTGAVNIVPDYIDEANLTQTTARIAVDESVAVPEFVRYALESPFVQSQINGWTKGSAQPGLNLGRVKKFRLPLPEIGEQERITSELNLIDKKIGKERQIKNNLSRLKKGLMQDLLSGTVRTTDTTIEVPDEIAQYG